MKMFVAAALLPMLFIVCGAIKAEAVDAKRRKAIVQGSEVTFNKYPYFAHSMREVTVFNLNQYCGAVLISPTLLLTAAHCLTEKITSSPLTSVYDKFPIGGNIMLDTADHHDAFLDNGIERTILNRTVHPCYFNDGSRSFYDFAVLEISEPVQDIEPITLTNDPLAPREGDRVTAMGFGLFEVGDPYDKNPSVLQEASITVVDTASCAREYGSPPRPTPFLLDDRIQFCHGGPIDNKANICPGDSGGPVIDEDGLLVGIVSFAYDGTVVACENHPAGSGRVGIVYDWAQQQICDQDGTLFRAWCCPEKLANTSMFEKSGDIANAIDYDHNLYSLPWCTFQFRYQRIVWMDRFMGDGKCMRIDTRETTLENFNVVLYKGNCDSVSCSVSPGEYGGRTFFAAKGETYRFLLSSSDVAGRYVVRLREYPGSSTKLLVCDSDSFDEVGTGVALTGDSAILLDAKSRVHIFREEDGVWHETPEGFFTSGGNRLAVDGATMVISGTGSDSDRGATVYEWDGDSWKPVADLRSTAGPSSSLGYSVGISGDTIVLGDPFQGGVGGSGAVYVYRRTVEGVWGSLESLVMSASDGTSGDFFGVAVSIHNYNILVGSPGVGPGDFERSIGAAYVFEKSGEAWPATETSKLVPCDGVGGDYFGGSVAVYDDRVVVSAIGSDGTESRTGAVYVFDKVGVDWNQTAKLAPSDNRAIAASSSIAIGNDVIFVGSKYFDPTIIDPQRGTRGSVFVFSVLGARWHEERIFSSDGSPDQEFGTGTTSAIAITDNYALVSSIGDNENGERAGAAYIYDRRDFNVGLPISALRCEDERPERLPRPPVIARNRGDPHMISFDGLEFDCQARGDFVLVKSMQSSFEIQARFSQASNLIDKVRASVMTGIVLKETAEDIVELVYPSTSSPMKGQCLSQLRLFVGGIEQSFGEDMAGSSFELIQSKMDEIVVRSVSSGMQVHLILGSSENFGCFLNQWIYLPEQFRDNETLLGLLGTPNGNMTDDWVSANNDILDMPGPNEALFEVAYSYCTTNWCVRDESLSLFSEIDGRSYSEISGCDDSYLQEMEQVVSNAPQPLRDICGVSIECLIDGIVGGLSDAEDFLSTDARIDEAILNLEGSSNTRGTTTSTTAVITSYSSPASSSSVTISELSTTTSASTTTSLLQQSTTLPTSTSSSSTTSATTFSETTGSRTSSLGSVTHTTIDTTISSVSSLSTESTQTLTTRVRKRMKHRNRRHSKRGKHRHRKRSKRMKGFHSKYSKRRKQRNPGCSKGMRHRQQMHTRGV